MFLVQIGNPFCRFFKIIIVLFEECNQEMLAVPILQFFLTLFKTPLTPAKVTWCSSKTSSRLWSLGFRPFRCVCAKIIKKLSPGCFYSNFKFYLETILKGSLLSINIYWSNFEVLSERNDQSWKSNFVIARSKWHKSGHQSESTKRKKFSLQFCYFAIF